jgi:hypothetical protein
VCFEIGLYYHNISDNRNAQIWWKKALNAEKDESHQPRYEYDRKYVQLALNNLEATNRGILNGERSDNRFIGDQQKEVADEEEIEKAKSSIMWSWVVTIVGSILFIAIHINAEANTPEVNRLSISIIGLYIFVAYCFWSTYWGLKLIWPWWKNNVRQPSDSYTGQDWVQIIVKQMLWILFFYIPVLLAGIYGTWGGGIVQYLKYSRKAKGYK